MHRAVLAFLCLSTAAFAQVPMKVDALAWMAGAWVSESPRGRVAETWLGPGNGLMVAANLSTFADGRRTFEFLRIAEADGAIVYFASPGGRAPVQFRMKELSGERVVFENAAHDFPQRIVYWRDGAALVARIEGSVRGEARSREWRFARTP